MGWVPTPPPRGSRKSTTAGSPFNIRQSAWLCAASDPRGKLGERRMRPPLASRYNSRPCTGWVPGNPTTAGPIVIPHSAWLAQPLLREGVITDARMRADAQSSHATRPHTGWVPLHHAPSAIAAGSRIEHWAIGLVTRSPREGMVTDGRMRADGPPWLPRTLPAARRGGRPPAAGRRIGDRLGWHGPDPRGHGHRYANARRWCSARKA
jgi:hypothetical protein